MFTRRPGNGLLVFAAVAIVAVTIAVVLIPRPPPEPPGKHEPDPTPNRIRLIVDASASMSGYLSKRTAFKDKLAAMVATLPRVVSTADGTPLQVTYAFARDAGVPFEEFTGTSQELIEQILNNRIPQGGSSMLPDVLRRITDEIQSDEVVILLTDGIPSYPNDQVKRNQAINLDNLEGLAAQIRLVFQDSGWTTRTRVRPGLAVLQYLSEFHGTYYSYRNDRLPCCVAPRPYYLWILGDSDRVISVFEAFRRSADLAPAHSIVLGPTRRPVNARVLNYSKRLGTWHRDRTDVLGVQRVAATGQIRLTIALDLKGVPDDILTRAHVMSHVDIQQNFARVKVVGFESRAEAQNELAPRDASELAGATHFLVLEVERLDVDSERVTITLRDVLPAWCEAATTLDDTVLPAREATPQTFGLCPIIKGAANALATEAPVFVVSLTLTR